jgi:hypothetical protein
MCFLILEVGDIGGEAGIGEYICRLRGRWEGGWLIVVFGSSANTTMRFQEMFYFVSLHLPVHLTHVRTCSSAIS